MLPKNTIFFVKNRKSRKTWLEKYMYCLCECQRHEQIILGYAHWSINW